MEQEIWKDIAGFEGMYQVSNLGRVKSCERTVKSKGNGVKIQPERILKPAKNNCGYLFVVLCDNGVRKHYTVHRLVATAFIPNNDLFADTINHKDEDKTNNAVSNLEWLSNGDNTRYSLAGPDGRNAGSKNYRAKPVRCIETGEAFGSATEASRMFGLNRNAVYLSIRCGGSCGGYHWKYID